MSDGRKLKIIANTHVNRFMLLLNKRVLKQSKYFNEVDRKFKRIMQKDKHFEGY